MLELLRGSRHRFSARKLIFLSAILIFGAALFIYYKTAYPAVRCQAAKHLDSPDEVADCYACHMKATPKIAQDWLESKHGVILIKCFVCHGQPDGKGSIPYAANPDVNTTCRKCHEPSMNEMERKYGIDPKCNECHPYHQNSLHHKPYVKSVSKKTID